MADVKQPIKSKTLAPMREDEIMDLVDAVMEETNPYHIPPELIPDGYAVEYKVMTVMGARPPNQGQNEILRTKTRWEAVNLSEHPQFKILGSESGDKNTVEKGGLILMMRPKEVQEKVKQIHEMKANKQLGDKFAQLSATSSGEAPRKVQSINRSYSPPVEVTD